MRGSAMGDRSIPLLLVGTHMEFELNEIENVFGDPKTNLVSGDHSANGCELTETELSKHYGYELASSSSDAAILDDSGDPSWGFDDSNDALDGLDHLEPFYHDCERPKRSVSVSELTCFSDYLQTSAEKMIADDFDKLETSLFTSEPPPKSSSESDPESANNEPLRIDGQTYDLIDSPRDCCHDYEDAHCNLSPALHREPSVNPPKTASSSISELAPSYESSVAAQQEKCISKTATLVNTIVKRMTLGQKIRFYAWFNSGLSIEEASKKSKIPDLIPPPMRHPKCKMSKKRLKRLSNILPTVYLQRQFVYETYFAGAEPKQVMTFLLTGLGLKNLMETFKQQLAFEKLGMEEKIRRRNATTVKQPSEKVSVRGEPSPQNFDVPSEETNSQSIACSNCGTLEGDELHKYCVGGEKCPFTSDATSNAQMSGPNPEIPRHPKCEYSWEKLEQFSKALPNENSRKKFLVEAYFEGEDPGEVMKVILSGLNESRKKKVGAADVLIRTPSPQSVETAVPIASCPQVSSALLGSSRNCNSSENDSKHKQENPKRGGNQIDSPVDSKEIPVPAWETAHIENEYEISLTSLNKMKKYYNLGFSHGEALAKALTPGFIPEPVPSPSCKHSWEGIEAMSSAILDKHERLKFQIDGFYDRGVMKRTSSIGKELSPLKVSHGERNISCKASHCNSASPVVDSVRSGLGELTKSYPDDLSDSCGVFQAEEITANEDPIVLSKLERNKPRKFEWCSRGLTEVADNTCFDQIGNSALNNQCNSVLELCNSGLKRYYGWCNKGLPHDEALSMVNNKKPNFANAKEWNLFDAKHPNCKHSKVKLKLLSEVLPEKWKRDRFFIHTYYGGMDPEDAEKLLKSRTPKMYLPIETERFGSERKMKLARNFQIDYLARRGMSREKVLSVLRNPPKELMEELNDAIQLNCGKKAMPAELKKLNDDEHMKIPLNSPYHPSKLLSITQLIDYYLWMSSGLTRGQAFHEIMNSHKPPKAVINSHRMKSKYTLEEMNEMSKKLPDEESAKIFVIETFYGQNDPEQIMKLLLFATNPTGSNPHMACRDSEEHLVDPSSALSLPSQRKITVPKEQPPQTESSTSTDELLCFIVPENFPGDNLTEPQMDAIESSMLEAILEMDDEDAKPLFKESFRSSGRYGIVCNNEFSVNWVYKYLRMYQPLEGTCLRLITNPPNKITANAVLPLCRDDDKKILHFIEKQNSGLNVGKWKVVHRWDNSYGNTLMDLVIDEESAKTVRKCSTISFKLGSAEIITAKSDRQPERSSINVDGAPSSPPLPPSPPPLPPTPPPLPKEPSIIDTSLGALLKISTSKSIDERPRKICDNFTDSVYEDWSPEGLLRKRRTSEDSREGTRSRPSFVDYSVPRNSPPDRIHKRKQSAKDSEPSASRSASHERAHRKRRKRHARRHRRSRTLDSHEDHSPGVEKHYSELPSTHSKLTSTSPWNFICTKDDDEASSIDNMEYADYLGNYLNDLVVDLTDST